MLAARRGVRVVDGAALEKRWAMSLVGSNPTLSASLERCWSGLTGAPGERVSPLATVGSNPTLSATLIAFFVAPSFLFDLHTYATMF